MNEDGEEGVREVDGWMSVLLGTRSAIYVAVASSSHSFHAWLVDKKRLPCTHTRTHTHAHCIGSTIGLEIDSILAQRLARERMDNRRGWHREMTRRAGIV
jgi:hypothetical protein